MFTKLNFCTLFDIGYTSRGLALYESLKAQCKSFHLYIFAFDEKSYEFLLRENLSSVTIISLKEFEDPKLLAVKPTRSRGEYCWTSTPATILYCLEKFSLDHCTYVDADLYFYSDPAVLVQEMGGGSVLVTEHRYTPIYDQSKTSGIYCVQFMTFKNNEDGLRVLKWWRDACLEWCFNRHEDGKFGDQKYLDDWLVRFSGVHSLEHLGGGVAPWNVQQYEFFRGENGVLSLTEKSSKREFPVVFYHFHSLKFLKDGTVDLSHYRVSKKAKELIYFPYVTHLVALQSRFNLDLHGLSEAPRGIRTFLRNIRRRLNGHYHKIPARNFMNGKSN